MFRQHHTVGLPSLFPLAGSRPAPPRFSTLRLVITTLILLIASMLLGVPKVVSDVSLTDAARLHSLEPSREIWLVEETREHQLYSNGLRLDSSHRTTSTHRFYQVLDRDRDMEPSPGWFSQPVGIVYHTTESPSAEFRPQANELLRRFSSGLLMTIRERQSYNFVIDRFGRVFRVVEELDTANHSGNSVWAHGRRAWLNLNNSFLAVAFEANTPPGGAPVLTAAQIHAGRLLTQLLRARYRIAAETCVTHAQVSVNPDNMRIGYHTDGAAGFPFRELGLPSNYELPLPSLAEFGFEYDETFKAAMGEPAWHGIDRAEHQLERGARQAGMTTEAYRGALRQRYRRLYAALRLTGAMDEPAQQ